MSAGSVGSHSSPQPVSRTMGAMPGRSLATTGTPAPIASNSLVGVFSWWLSVSPSTGIADTSAAAMASRMSAGATGPGKWIRSAWGRLGGQLPEALVVGAVARHHEHRRRAPARWPRTAAAMPRPASTRPRYSTTGVSGRKPQALVPQSAGRLGRDVVRRAVPDDPRLAAPLAGQDIRVGGADRDHLVHAPRPATLAALQQRPPGTRQPREPGALRGQVAGVVDRRTRPGCAAAGPPPAAPRAPPPATRRWASPGRPVRVGAAGDGRRDGVRPDPGQPQVARRLGGPAEARLAATRPTRASRPAAEDRGCLVGPRAGAGWAATASGCGCCDAQDAEAIHELVRRQTRRGPGDHRHAVAGIGQRVGHLPDPGVVLERVVDDERGGAHRAARTARSCRAGRVSASRRYSPVSPATFRSQL